MNIIQIVSDTLRRDYLGCYGNSWIHTEHIDRFAEDSVVFDNAYIASFPTIPHRHDLFTGRYTFVYSTWAPLPRDEVILSQLLRQAGYVTMLIVDTPHMIRDAHYFDRGFDGWWWIRGQEHDRYMTNRPDAPEERQKALGRQYLQNVSMRMFEEDYFVAQTMTSAVKWLELNYDQHKKFFLHIDTFDPHEPWDPPRWYADMYDPGWKGGEVPGGAYVVGVQRPAASELTEEQINHLRALYAGEVTLVDRWVGKLLQKIEDLGLLEDTVVIFTTDHGTYIGEHNYVGKRPHLYEEVAHIPLIMRLPDSAGAPTGRRDEIVQSPDIMPTILELAGVKIPPTVQARSLLSIIQGESEEERSVAVSSASLVGQRLPDWITVTSKRWALLASHKESGVKSELYDLSRDPQETENLIDEEPEVADDLRLEMIKLLRSWGAKEETLRKWMEGES
jgi:arylsulfatase A-like enzyme